MYTSVLKPQHVLIAILFFITFSLRFVNLGYSDYQGDEIKALFRPEPHETAGEFLLDQRKGPGQFMVTYGLKIFDHDYSNRLFNRIPFALAGALAVVLFYKIAALHFDKKIAFYAAFFIATNGFFVALSRIIQYQSFTIFFMVLTLYLFSLAQKYDKWKIIGIYLGFISWALSILFHYDGVFIFPFAFYLLGMWYFKHGKAQIKHLIYSLIVSGLMLISFYIPFILSISQATWDYWLNRVSGGQGKISSSKYLFQVYQPIYVIHIYTILFILGLSRFVTARIPKKTGLMDFWTKKKEDWFKDFEFSPKKELNTLVKKPLFYVFLWFFIPMVFMEFMINIPGTHIYSYLLPATVVIAFGINFLERLVGVLLQKFYPLGINIAGIGVIFTFIYLQSYFVFVDHTREYPWQNEGFYVWEFHKPSSIFHLSMFGFPYYRYWDEIGKFVRSGQNTGAYSTNERKSIARYHIPFRKSTDDAGHFVWIKDPQSFTNEILSSKAAYWAEKYPPVMAWQKDGKNIAEIYYLEPGTLDEIRAKGF